MSSMQVDEETKKIVRECLRTCIAEVEKDQSLVERIESDPVFNQKWIEMRRHAFGDIENLCPECEMNPIEKGDYLCRNCR